MDTLLDKGVMHGGTYNGNVQSMAAALAALDELERDDGAVYRDLEQRGTRLMQGLSALGAKHKLPVLVQGLPAIFQTFFTTGPAPEELPRLGGMRSRHGAGVPHGAAGAGHPGQPAHGVVPLDRARRRHHRRDPGGGRSRHGGARVSDIRLEGVSKRYGPVAAADEVDLAVAQGEFVTILGPSGSGKTTLLSLIAGLNRPTAGRIFIGGRDVTDAPAQQRNIGLVFQSYALFPHMTVLENVLFPLGVRKIGGAVARSQALDALKLVRLEGLQDRRPSQLSGGQQQRVALARAIVFKPDILLLDEPLGALDRKLREELQVELKQLQRTLGVTTILVTHDQEEALSLSDRIMVLDKGRTQQVAAPAEAYLRPANRFVAEFLGIANFVGLEDGRTGLVRPERVRIGAVGSEGKTARVVEAIYLGQMVRYHLALENGAAGAPMVAAVPFVGRAFATGERVAVSWEAADIWPV